MAMNTNEVNSLAAGVTNIEAGYNADFGNYNITNTAAWPRGSILLWLGDRRYFPGLPLTLRSMLHKMQQQLPETLNSKTKTGMV